MASEDRTTFAFISINLLLGVIFLFHSLSWIDTRQYSLVMMICCGGMVPAVFNIKTQMWMKNECKIPNYIDVPSNNQIIANFVNIILVIIGFMIIIYSFGKDLDKPDVTGEGYPNFLAICTSCLSGLLLGYAFG